MLLDKNIINYEIAKYLDICDLYRLKCANRYLSNCFDLSSKLVNTISKRLSSVFRENLNDLKSLLNKTGAVISGSFIIQSILNEHWNTNIDIYVSMKYNEELRDFLHKNIVSLSKYDDGYANHWIIEDLSYSFMNIRKCKTIYHPKIIVHDRYHIGKNKTKINLWGVESENINDFVSKTGDLDIGKNVYGVNSNKEYIKVKTLDQIINRKTEFKISKPFYHGLERYHKYIDRGFTFTNDINLMFDKIIARSGKHFVFWVEQINDTQYEVIDGDINVLKSFPHVTYDPKRRKGYPIVPDFILDGNYFKFGDFVTFSDCPDDPDHCSYCNDPRYTEHVHVNNRCPVSFCFPSDVKLHFHVYLYDYDLIFIYY